MVDYRHPDRHPRRTSESEERPGMTAGMVFVLMSVVTLIALTIGYYLGQDTASRINPDHPFKPEHHQTVVYIPKDAKIPGDDNGDGIIQEDETGWDCRTMGNNICGKHP